MFNGFADHFRDHFAADIAFAKDARCFAREVKNRRFNADGAFSAVKDEVGFAVGLLPEVITHMLSGCRTDLAEGVGARCG